MVKLEQGKIIEGYRLITQIGSGASTQIWQVEQIDTSKSFALKVIPTDLHLDSEELKSQLDTFAEFADVEHENLLRTIHYDFFEGAPYAIVPLCEGDLEKEIRSRSLAIIESSGYTTSGAAIFNEKELVEIMMAAASGLDFLHTKMKKAHLDVKPANILYRKGGTEQQYLLSDFDVAVSLKEDIIRKTVKRGSNNGKTQTGGFTVGYMAPEQCDPNYEADVRSDIFSLGVTMYELATGKLPAQPSLGQSFFHYGENITIRPLPAKHFSADFQELVFDCLKADPDRRPTAALIKSYGQFYLSTGKWPSGAPTPSGKFFSAPVEQTPSQVKKRGGILLPILASVLAITLAFWWLLLPNYQRSLLGKVDSLMELQGKEKINEALALLDKAQIQALPPKYDSLQSELTLIKNNLLGRVGNLGKLSENTLAYQEIDTRKWGFYRLGCGTIKEAIFDDVGEFSHGYAPFQMGDTAGFLDLKGKIPFQERGIHPQVINKTTGQMLKTPPGQPVEDKTISLPVSTGMPDCQ